MKKTIRTNTDPIVARILRELERKNMSRSELCRRVGIPVTTFSNYVIRGGSPQIDVLEKISDELGVSVAFLRSGIEPTENLEGEAKALVSRIGLMPREKQEMVLKAINSFVVGALRA